MKLELCCFALTCAATFGAASLNAQGYGQVPGPHPAYIHALGDLRAARHYLTDNWAWAPVKHEDDVAIHHIDAAFNEIKMASIDDGKNINDRFPIDGSLTPQSRFVKANELLYAAHQDLAHAEDVPQARGLRDRALHEVDAAHDTVDKAVRISHWQ